MKHFLSLIIAGCFVLLTEGLLWITHPGDVPNNLRSQLLHMAYRKPIRIERILAAVKFDAFVGQQAEFVQIGESTGLVSVRPDIIRQYIPRGWRYLNASLQAPAQFEGMEALADRILSEDRKRKYLVGIFSMFHLGKNDEGFGNEIAKDYDSPDRFLLMLPSLRYRGPVIQRIYYGPTLPYNINYMPLINSLRESVLSSDGWMPAESILPFTAHKCTATMFNPERAMNRLERLEALAKRHNVTLILTLGPARCDYDESIRRIEEVFEEFHRRHPDVIYPLPLYHQLPDALFADEVHVLPKGAESFSNQWGKALQKALAPRE